MSKIEPSVSLTFLVKNLGKIIKMKLSNFDKVNQFVETNERLDQPIIPDFEGIGKPMDEGMIYLMFDSTGDDKVESIDTVMRLFWVSSEALKYHQIDSFLISENYQTKQWDHFQKEPLLLEKSKSRFKQKVRIKNLDFSMDGKWQDGYHLEFDDRENKISGNLTLSALDPSATLVYYNGRIAIVDAAYQRFYDSFGLEMEGTINLDNKELEIKNGRAIIEHGVGLFSTENFVEWQWLNIQLSNGSIHLFRHPFSVDDKIIQAGEGAAVINGEWLHFIKNDFDISPIEFDEEADFEKDVPTKWEVKITHPEDETTSTLTLNSIANHSWKTFISEDTTHYVTNYVLDVQGELFGKSISGRSTLEHLIVD